MKFWWMFGNHTFADLGTDLEPAIERAKVRFDEDPHGSLFVRGDDFTNATAPYVSGSGRHRKAEFLTELTRFREQVQAAHNYTI